MKEGTLFWTLWAICVLIVCVLLIFRPDAWAA
jgi:hypothetical protein